jgi:tetratricopeptide (TPR) repeat protein
MDDLNGLSWTSGPNASRKPPPMSSGSLFSSMPASSASGKSTPVSRNLTASNPSSKPSTPANDSFANLVSFGSSNTNNKNLSLLEQQKLLQQQRAKQEAERRAQFEAQYGGPSAQFLDSLGQNGSKRAPYSAVPQVQTSAAASDEDDLLAAFNASAPVDASTHFPVPSSNLSPQFNSTSNQASHRVESASQPGGTVFPEDDDPFGLGHMSSTSTTALNPPIVQDDDDDFLGLLGKPVSELRVPVQATTETHDRGSRSSPHPGDPRDRAIAELVDMGFPPDKAGQALDNTESGVDVQAAVGWLLNQAHADSRQKVRAKADAASHDESGRSTVNRERRRDQSERGDKNIPPWMKGQDVGPHPSRDDSRSPASRERDVAELAANWGNQIFKTANSLWKTGSKKVQKAVHDLNAESDASQPRWMRDAASVGEDQRNEPQTARGRQGEHQIHRDDSINQEQNTSNNFTQEALLLESGAARPTHHPTRVKGDRPTSPESKGSVHTTNFPYVPNEKNESKPAFIRQQRQQEQSLRSFAAKDPKSRLTRAAVEEQSSEAYVSPARRRQRAQQQPAAEPTANLLESSRPSVPLRHPSQPSQSPRPLPSRPKAPARTIPHVSPSSLMSSFEHRERGNAAYKRGDYAAAHEAFAKSLSFLPNGHPITIIVLSNRAMTALKIGEPKAAITDADSTLAVIGPSRGEGEEIELGNGQAAKPMRDFFGKALMRKAEALEHLEKWEDAAKVWKQAVETGHGGSTSIQGRNRCEKAAGISKPTPVVPSSTAPRPSQPKRAPVAPRKSALHDLVGDPAQNPKSTAEAVTRLRAANAAADRADEERLVLTDSVDAKIAAWKGGKQDNLRALLGSLDSILWPEAGWKKINMSELVLPNKVKIHYMKGIAKVHPDKVRSVVPFLPVPQKYPVSPMYLSFVNFFAF